MYPRMPGGASDDELYRRAQKLSRGALKQSRSNAGGKNYVVGGILLAAVTGICILSCKFYCKLMGGPEMGAGC